MLLRYNCSTLSWCICLQQIWENKKDGQKLLLAVLRGFFSVWNQRITVKVNRLRSHVLLHAFLLPSPIWTDWKIYLIPLCRSKCITHTRHRKAVWWGEKQFTCTEDNENTAPVTPMMDLSHWSFSSQSCEQILYSVLVLTWTAVLTFTIFNTLFVIDRIIYKCWIHHWLNMKMQLFPITVNMSLLMQTCI